jgi:hypothetical protein
MLFYGLTAQTVCTSSERFGSKSLNPPTPPLLLGAVCSELCSSVTGGESSLLPFSNNIAKKQFHPNPVVSFTFQVSSFNQPQAPNSAQTEPTSGTGMQLCRIQSISCSNPARVALRLQPAPAAAAAAAADVCKALDGVGYRARFGRAEDDAAAAVP